MLARLMREHPDAAELREARYLAHRARFEHALAIADIEAPQPDEETAYERLEELAGEPWDPAVGAATLAVGAILGKAGLEERAQEVTAGALQAWIEGQCTRASVAVGIGYSGCTVHLEGTDDGWSVVRLSSFWIT